MATVSRLNTGNDLFHPEGKDNITQLAPMPRSGDIIIEALGQHLTLVPRVSSDILSSLAREGRAGSTEAPPSFPPSPIYTSAAGNDALSHKSTDTFGKSGQAPSVSGTPASSIRTNGILRGRSSVEQGDGSAPFDMFDSDEEEDDEDAQRMEAEEREMEQERRARTRVVQDRDAEVDRKGTQHDVSADAQTDGKDTQPPPERSTMHNSDGDRPSSYSAANLLESCYIESRTDRRALYQQSGQLSSLKDWAPRPEPNSRAWGGIKHLPDWRKIKAGDPTSRPIEVVRKDLEWSMQQLLNKEAFEQLILSEVGRHKFREYLASHSLSVAIQKLDMYFDLCQYGKHSQAVCAASEGMSEIYFTEEKDATPLLPDEMSAELLSLLQKQAEIRASLQPLQQHLLQSLHRSEFQLFVKSQLIEHSRVRLGSFDEEDIRQTGLGDCYCLTNPRLKENPIVLVSPGFERVTGYPRDQIIGRNCRFLQGPGTAPESIQRVRNATTAGESCTELLLNYRLDGTPFFCLLTIIPIHDSSGALSYFIGGQTNVNGLFLGRDGLSFLAGVGSSEAGGASTSSSLAELSTTKKMGGGYEVSPSLARYLRTDGHMATLESSREDNRSISSSQGESSRGSRSIKSSSETENESSAIVTDRSPAALLSAPSSSITTSTSEKKNARGPSKLFQRSGRQGSFVSSFRNIALAPPLSQTVLGKEGSMRKEAHSLEEQIEYFTSLYSKLIIFLREKREIIYTTRGCLDFVGLSTHTWQDLHASPLMHADMLSIIEGSNTLETRSSQRAIQSAINNGVSISIKVGIKRAGLKGRSSTSARPAFFTSKEKVNYTVLHITPLHGSDESAHAFVAVLS